MTDQYDSTAPDLGAIPLWAEPSDFAPLTEGDRPCPITTDAPHEVRAVYTALSRYLWRLPKVLDPGHYRTGFPPTPVPDQTPTSAGTEACDLVLFTVAGQIKDTHVREATLEAACGWADIAGVVLYETAWDDRIERQWHEPPGDLKRLRRGFAFVHTIRESDDGNTGYDRRVLLFCSNRYWYADGYLDAFDSWTPYSHEMVGDLRQGWRRYFFSADTIIKNYCLYGQPGRDNRRDMEFEVSFLLSPPVKNEPIPRLVAYHIGERDAVLVMERLPGILLTTAIKQNRDYDPALVLRNTLRSLDALERVGLFHNDLEIWNVLVGNDGSSALIDFASITGEERSAWLPYSLIHCFFLFAQNVIHRQLPSFSTAQFPVKPFSFPRDLRRWAALVWTHPPGERNFALLKSCLDTALEGRPLQRRRSGLIGRILRLYQRLSYHRALIDLQMSFFWEWIKAGGFRLKAGCIIGSLIRSFTARPLTALTPIPCRNPRD
jgi:predicted Ser/Thr protein kinase